MSLTLRKEHRLSVSENRVLRRIFGHKMEEDRYWRKLQNGELHGLYSSPNIVRVIKPTLHGVTTQKTSTWNSVSGAC
jgi:hypothetical protein